MSPRTLSISIAMKRLPTPMYSRGFSQNYPAAGQAATIGWSLSVGPT